MTTYIVQVDSNYRDVNKYVNSSDFAVSFQPNKEPAYNNIQGNPISPSGYFLNCSVDPDFKNTKLQVINGSFNLYEEVGDDVFVSGNVSNTDLI